MNARPTRLATMAVAAVLPLAILAGGAGPFTIGKRAAFGILSVGAVWLALMAERVELRRRIAGLAASPLAGPAVAWTMIVLAGFVAAPSGTRSWLAVWEMMAGAGWMLALSARSDGQLAGRVGGVYLGAAGLAAAYALVQFAGADPWQWERTYAGGAPPSTAGNPLFLGSVLAAALPFAGAALVTGGFGYRVPAGALAVIMAAFAVTGARGAWAGAAVGLALFVARGPGRAGVRRIGVAVAIGLVAVVVAVRWGAGPAAGVGWWTHAAGVVNPAQWRGRRLIWESGAVLARRAPLLGRGAGGLSAALLGEESRLMGRPRYAGMPYRTTAHLHLDLLQRWVEVGVLGAGVWLWAVIIAVHAGCSRGAGAWRRAAACATVGWLIDGLVNGPAHVAPTSQLFWIFLGLAAGPGGGTPEADQTPIVHGGPRASAPWVAGTAVVAALLAVPHARDALGDLWLGAGSTLAESQPEVAIRALEMAGRCLTEDRRQHFHAGRACYLAGRPGRAAMEFREDVLANPFSAAAWLNLGLSLEATGNRAEAALCRREAARLAGSGSTGESGDRRGTP